jgi:hypothetical protein
MPVRTCSAWIRRFSVVALLVALSLPAYADPDHVGPELKQTSASILLAQSQY